jgi:shikimate dehydrogenase
MRTAGVIGWPIAHSKSPIIHRFWLEALGLDGDYVRLPVDPDTALEAIRALPLLGFSGVNVTVPLKTVALKAADRLDLSAAVTGAANVLVVEHGRLAAYNSDRAGFLEPLERRGLRPDTLVLLGAGGAARAVVMAAQALGVSHMTFVNRSAEPARELAGLWEDLGGTADVLALEPGIDLPPADLVVNATSLGMTGQPPLMVALDSLRPGTIVYDLVYAPLETALLADARARGLQGIDGLEMLVGQARLAFELFYGAAAPADRDSELRARLVGALG